MATTDVLWAAWEGRGFEHLTLSAELGAVRADSLIIAVDDDGRPYRARYVVDCDASWKVTRARVEVIEQPARVLDVRVDSRGRWMDAVTGAVLALDGCVDIDIYPSPFTNTLPIRRLADVAVGRPVSIDVAWVVLPELTIQSARQESGDVALASLQLSAAVGELANGVQQQAASLEETAATLEQITQAVKQSGANSPGARGRAPRMVARSSRRRSPRCERSMRRQSGSSTSSA